MDWHRSFCLGFDIQLHPHLYWLPLSRRQTLWCPVGLFDRAGNMEAIPIVCCEKDLEIRIIGLE